MPQGILPGAAPAAGRGRVDMGLAVDNDRERLRAGVRRHAGVYDAGDQCHASRTTRRLCRVPHDVALDGQPLFLSHVHLHGGPAPARQYLPKLIDLVFNVNQPGKVFDLVLPVEQVAEGYRAMNERPAIKTLLRP